VLTLCYLYKFYIFWKIIKLSVIVPVYVIVFVGGQLRLLEETITVIEVQSGERSIDSDPHE
jgi:hypothetical protein